jgi:hypothetical protein
MQAPRQPDELTEEMATRKAVDARYDHRHGDREHEARQQARSRANWTGRRQEPCQRTGRPGSCDRRVGSLIDSLFNYGDRVLRGGHERFHVELGSVRFELEKVRDQSRRNGAESRPRIGYADSSE